MQPCRGCDPGSNPGRGATQTRTDRLHPLFLTPFVLPTSCPLPRALVGFPLPPWVLIRN